MGDSYKAWGLALESLSPRSGVLYRAGLALLFTRMGYTTEAYYSEYKAALDAGDSRKINILINTVKSEITKLSREYSSSHTAQSFKAYLSFMRANFRDVVEFDSGALNNWRKAQIPERNKHIPSIDKKGILNYIEKAKMFGRTDISTLRDIALIHVLKDTGLSRVDVVRMDVGDVLPTIEAGREFVMLEDARQKTGVEMYPIVGPESLRAIKVYLEARQKNRRRYIDPTGNRQRSWVNVPGEVLRADSPLFIFTQRIGDFNYGDRFQPDTVTSTFSKLNKNMDPGEEHFSPHSMRKYNWLMLEYSRVPKNWMCFLQGRTITDSSEAYTLDFDNHPKEAKATLLKAYREAYQNISVEDENEKKLKALEESKKEGDAKVEELQMWVRDQQRTIDLMMPAFNMAQRMFSQREEWEKRRNEAPAPSPSTSR